MARIIDKIKGTEAKSTAKDVLSYFWKGMRQDGAVYFLCVLLFIIASSSSIISPIFYRKILDLLTTATDKTAAVTPIIHWIFIILAVNVSSWLAFRTGSFLYNIVSAKTIARLKQQSFEYMIDHSYSFFSNNFTGSLVQRVGRFARAFEVLVDTFIWSFIPLTVRILGVITVLYFINPIISAVILSLVIIFCTFNYIFSRWKVKYDIQLAEADSKTTGLLSDNVTNQNAIQLFTGNKFEAKNFKEVTDKNAHIMHFTWNLGGVVDAVQAFSLIVTEFLLFFVATHYWQMGIITIGTFVLIQVYLVSVGSQLWDFSRIVRNVYQSFADGKEMADILLTKHEIKDLPDAKNLSIADGTVTFKDVGFSFNKTREVLKNTSVTIPGGQKLALIGPSGAGKSTFVRLILRLYDVSQGEILIDGQNIQHVTQESLREHLSLVPQDPILFHRSLKDNIRYGRRDATDEEVIHAAKLAHCDEFIKDLPQGYETLVGERGIKLSGGERQRVAIARAILKNTPILILDEATSSLDSESESYIQDALDTLMKGKTVIVIAHRLSTIRKMDRIIVLEDGKIREEGSHDELLKVEASLYRKLWNLQAGGFIPI